MVILLDALLEISDRRIIFPFKVLPFTRKSILCALICSLDSMLSCSGFGRLSTRESLLSLGLAADMCSPD